MMTHYFRSYMSFKARNVLFFMMMAGDGWGLSFPDICLRVEEEPWKKPQPGKLAQPRNEPGPTG